VRNRIQVLGTTGKASMMPNDPHGGFPGWYGKNPGKGQGKGEDTEASSTQVAGGIHHIEEGQEIAGNLSYE
jgi:hypothetical protein